VKDAGFSLIEVMVALTICIVGALSLGQLLVASDKTRRTAYETTRTLLLAEQKIEALRSLECGSGLCSPPGKLDVDTQGYVDYLDSDGELLANNSVGAPPGTAYIRRWSVDAVAGSAIGTTVVQVLVMPVMGIGARAPVHLVALTRRQ
jgi:type II secretory pathway pseudopilin PulG